jgi:hypothetical protein
MPLLLNAMPAPSASIPPLRLVNNGTFPDGAPLPARHGAPRLRVARENVGAATVSAIDPRWVFAVQVARSIGGGRAAILAPERRQKLVAMAGGMGLRPFDANLIIAVVQDGVRSGDGALSPQVESRLAFIRGAAEPERRGKTLAVVLLTAAIAVGIFCVLARWVGT